jgi:hypothetical protein
LAKYFNIDEYHYDMAKPELIYRRYSSVPAKWEFPKFDLGTSQLSSTAFTHLNSLENNRTQFKYPLIQDPGEIRLIKIEPSEHNDAPISCIIVNTTLNHSPAYEALSYVWGDPSERLPILVDAAVMTVTTNLWCALVRLRRLNKPRLVWVDALSIDQGNLHERSRQVGMMAEIFKGAEQVIIWLGEHADGSELVFQCWEQFELGKIKHPRGYHYDFPDYREATMDAFVKLCQRQWFYRIWTIQELLLSQKAVIMCSYQILQWEKLFKISRSEYHKVYHPIFGLDAVSHCLQLCLLLGRRYGLLECDRNRVGDFFNFSRSCDSTDPRDQVYGLCECDD